MCASPLQHMCYRATFGAVPPPLAEVQAELLRRADKHGRTGAAPIGTSGAMVLPIRRGSKSSTTPASAQK